MQMFSLLKPQPKQATLYSEWPARRHKQKQDKQE